MNNEKLLRNRKGKGAAADAALTKAKAGQASESNSSASQADRHTVEAEQHLIATVMEEGSQAPIVESGVPEVVAPPQTVPPKGEDKAKYKRAKRPREAGSSGPVVQETTTLPLRRPATDIWEEIASLVGVELPSRTSTEATSAALAVALSYWALCSSSRGC
ncbi:unnamed protein product [Cuscuta epithymum]|uniref:Uncharacterized protein n=1 Tax=Cuscuta epithymum TaxID=186058 RepID=A0AAV0DEJ2_9ASTE|nr:unnamed protein product [Cuscuta epithymum]